MQQIIEAMDSVDMTYKFVVVFSQDTVCVFYNKSANCILNSRPFLKHMPC